MNLKTKAKVDSSRLVIQIDKFNTVLLQNVQTAMTSIVQDYHENVVNAVNGPAYGLVPMKKRYVSFKDKSGKIAFFKTRNKIYKRGSLTNAGKLPIPLRTGKLKKATTAGLLRRFEFFWNVVVDSKVVPYARYVHDGTQYMRPRPFLVWVMRDRRQAYINALRYAFKKSEKQI